VSGKTDASEVSPLAELLHGFLRELGVINVNPVGMPRRDSQRKVCITRFHVTTTPRVIVLRLPGAVWAGGDGELFNTVRAHSYGVTMSGSACEAAYRDWVAICRFGRNLGPGILLALALLGVALLKALAKRVRDSIDD
jgi:hypothetical protein